MFLKTYFPLIYLIINSKLFQLLFDFNCFFIQLVCSFFKYIKSMFLKYYKIKNFFHLKDERMSDFFFYFSVCLCVCFAYIERERRTYIYYIFKIKI